MARPDKTFCNPLNLNYRFKLQNAIDEECCREAADPSAVMFNGEIWLFASKSSGYWHSADLAEWHYIESAVLPVEDYAPDIRVINGQLHFTASRPVPSPVYRTSNPLADDWELVGDGLPWHDPNLFQDDDGRVYAYWGCSTDEPIYGVEMDPETMQPIGETVPLFGGDPAKRGWERRGDDNGDPGTPHVEGAWMTKAGDTYYLQYSAPGTEYNVYGDGVYTSKSPLGPFEYAAHNPYSFKPGGFINGAGHGSTVEDRHGNLWHLATMRISVKHMFERRLGLFPAGIDTEGNLFCNTSFADYPTRIPKNTWDPLDDPFAGWMLLSYEKDVRASSALDGHGPELAVNEDVRDYWSAASGDAGEWFQIDLGSAMTMEAVQINFAEHGCACYGRDPEAAHRYVLEASCNGDTWSIIRDTREAGRDRPHDYVQLEEPVRVRFVRITNHGMPAGGTFAVSGLRIFGQGNGEAPGAVEQAAIDRVERRTVKLEWQEVNQAVGYDVRWGIAPDKLYHSWLVYGKNSLNLTALNAGCEYCYRIDAFNENGVTTGAVLA